MTDLRQQILDTDDIKEEEVGVEEWNCKILVRGLTGKDRSEILTSALTRDGRLDFSKVYPDLVIATSFDPETGEKIFSKTDREVLNEKSGSALEKIAGKAVKLSGLGAEGVNLAVKN